MTPKEFLRNRAFPFLLGHLIKGFLTIIGWTCTFRFQGIEHLVSTASTTPCILAFWHNRLGMVIEILKRAAPQFRYAAMISKSKDGEIISVIAESYSHGRSIRVPHNKRAFALKEMIRDLKIGKEVIVITPDGPRGPLYSVKPGILLAAQEASAYIIPLSWKADRAWHFKTWDRMILPKPFSKIDVIMGAPIAPQDSQLLGEKLLSLE